ncbi:hypothetical protein LTR37_007367 [Vermiconidia calcicola]|uniref:Uncharacterized protein n=1 Tax=Vermiconidia calcicola TaxID=1690605 RepID=A0ACC3NDS0_9PEZI|nr:hypothetical protein LTR37_007367 [Vermiconidia calcicola]
MGSLRIATKLSLNEIPSLDYQEIPPAEQEDEPTEPGDEDSISVARRRSIRKPAKSTYKLDYGSTSKRAKSRASATVEAKPSGRKSVKPETKAPPRSKGSSNDTAKATSGKPKATKRKRNSSEDGAQTAQPQKRAKAASAAPAPNESPEDRSRVPQTPQPPEVGDEISADQEYDSDTSSLSSVPSSAILKASNSSPQSSVKLNGEVRTDIDRIISDEANRAKLQEALATERTSAEPSVALSEGQRTDAIPTAEGEASNETTTDQAIPMTEALPPKSCTPELEGRPLNDDMSIEVPDTIAPTLSPTVESATEDKTVTDSTRLGEQAIQATSSTTMPAAHDPDDASEGETRLPILRSSPAPSNAVVQPPSSGPHQREVGASEGSQGITEQAEVHARSMSAGSTEQASEDPSLAASNASRLGDETLMMSGIEEYIDVRATITPPGPSEDEEAETALEPISDPMDIDGPLTEDLHPGTPQGSGSVKIASQLPTPPSSVNPDEVAEDKRMPNKRPSKPPKQFPGLVGTPGALADAEVEDDSDAIPQQAETSHGNSRSKGKQPVSQAKSGKKADALRTASSGPKKTPPKSGNTVGKVAPSVKKGRATKPQQEENTPAKPSSKKDVATSLQTPPSTQSTVKVKAKQKQITKKNNTVKKSEVVALSLPTLQLEPQKLELSRKLTRREPLGSRPLPAGGPKVWADSRQALCETLPYFKKPQGGCYQNDGHVYGFLFDSVGHVREYMDENVIICRAGGAMEADTSGGMVQKKDQLMKEAQVQAVLNDIAHHNPLIVICGDRNTAALCKMPHQYSVLGWYKPVRVWAEKTAGKGVKMWTTIKYRLERLNRHREAWHAPKGDSRYSEEDKATAGEQVLATCIERNCRETYPQVYLEGWMCLNATCSRFWKINGILDAQNLKDGLHYDPAFLFHESELWKDEKEEDEPEPSTLRPLVPIVGRTLGDNLASVNTRGICCPHCGRCNSRRLFKGWVCEHPACDYSFFPEHKPVLPVTLHTPWDTAPTLVRNRYAPGVDAKVGHKYGFKLTKYEFDGIKGCFIHAAASKRIIEETGGANEMFAAMQTEDMHLERRTFAVKKMSGGKGDKDPAETSQAETDPVSTQQEGQESVEASDGQRIAQREQDDSQKTKYEFEDGDLMTAFSMNYGMPYKFVAGGASRSFEEGPESVRECRRRLNWAQKVFLNNPDNYEDFNEELIFAYLEGQKIEYHHDGEQGLGPRIATLSLGGRAKMHMRMKMKHYVGCSKTGVLTDDDKPPVPGGIGGPEMDEKRLKAWRELRGIKHDSRAYNQRRKEIPKELGLYEKRMKKADDLVTVTLSHGDIIIMDGYEIQKYLEHKVVPEGYLRFALTCRTVLPDHLKEEERPSYAVKEDEVTYDGPVHLRTAKRD